MLNARETAALEDSLLAERIALTRDGFLNASSLAVSLAAGMALVPALLAGLSREMYGVWISALVLQYSAAFLSSGLGRSVVQEVARSGTGEDTRRFLVAAGNLYLLLGVSGAVMIAIIGLPLAAGFHLAHGDLKVARLVFALVGLGFCSDQVQLLATDILTGLRRFRSINVVKSATVLVRAAGIFFVMHERGSIVKVAVWHVMVGVVTAITLCVITLKSAPQLRPRQLRFRWADIREKIHYSVMSQVTAGCGNLLWTSAPFLIGVLRGPLAIVPYEIGQKFPMGISAIAWQIAEVSFPAASAYHGARQEEHTRQVLEVGTRVVLFFAIPMCLILWILAPSLLKTWVGYGFSEAAWILRFTTIAILAEAYAATSIQVLWAQGRVTLVLKLTAMAAVINVAIACLLVPRLGAVGASIGLALSVSVAAPCYVLLATETCGSSVCRLMSALRPLSLPTLFSAAVVLLMAPQAGEGWPHLGFAVGSTLVTYAASLYLIDGRSLKELC